MYGREAYFRDLEPSGNPPTIGEGQPYQLYKRIQNVGKNIESSKKKIIWAFSFGEDDSIHRVVLEHSTISGKKKLFLNGELIFESQKVGNFDWSHGWPMGSHVCRCDILGEGNYELTIDAKRFALWPHADKELLGELAKAKKESEKTLREDEQRRLDMINEQRRYDMQNSKKGSFKTLSKGLPPARSNRGSSAASIRSLDNGKSKRPPKSTVDLLSNEPQQTNPKSSQNSFDPFVFKSQPIGTRSLSENNAANELLNIGARMNRLDIGTHNSNTNFQPSNPFSPKQSQNWNSQNNATNQIFSNESVHFGNSEQNVSPQNPFNQSSLLDSNTQPPNENLRPPLMYSQSQYIQKTVPDQSHQRRDYAALGISMMGVNSGTKSGALTQNVSIDSAFKTQEEVFQEREMMIRQQHMTQSYMTTPYPNTMNYGYANPIQYGYQTTNNLNGSYSSPTLPEHNPNNVYPFGNSR